MAQNYYISVKHCSSTKIHTPSSASIYMFHFFKYLKCSHLFFDNKLNLVHFRQFQLLFAGRLYFSTINTLNVFHWVQVKQHSWQVIFLFSPFFRTFFLHCELWCSFGIVFLDGYYARAFVFCQVILLARPLVHPQAFMVQCGNAISEAPSVLMVLRMVTLPPLCLSGL